MSKRKGRSGSRSKGTYSGEADLEGRGGRGLVGEGEGAVVDAEVADRALEIIISPHCSDGMLLAFSNR